MTGEYRKPGAAAGGMRLHLNENTAGCSPRVLEVLRTLERIDAALYPDYRTACEAAAAYFGVPVDHVLLTNGLDEGILAATISAFRDRDGGVPEALGVAPAFDMYEVCTDAVGGRMVTVPLGEDFAFSAPGLRSAMTPHTRIVFVTNPHNPTGGTVPLDVLRALAADVAPALLFIDEAYAEFAGESVISPAWLAATPNAIIGRTFAKAFGIAGLRAGALVAAPQTLAPLRRAVPPYSLNAVTAAILPVALEDRAYRDWYVAEAAESRQLLAAACARLGLKTWPSAANFMLVHAGTRATDVAQRLAARGVVVRDKSADPASRGCLRMTTGTVEDTRRLIAALEEVLCGNPE